MCSAALAALLFGAVSAIISTAFAYMARGLRAPISSVWGVYLDGPAGYSKRGIQFRKLALIGGALGLASFLTFVGLVWAGATCWSAS
jgi:hypothetical protein